MLNLSLSQDLPSSCDCAITETWTGSALVLSVTGVLDMLTAGSLQEAVDAALAQQPATLVVDLSDVSFLASHGMNVLVSTHYRAGSESSVIVVADGPVTARPLALVGITDILTMYPTLDQALTGVVAA